MQMIILAPWFAFYSKLIFLSLCRGRTSSPSCSALASLSTHTNSCRRCVTCAWSNSDSAIPKLTRCAGEKNPLTFNLDIYTSSLLFTQLLCVYPAFSDESPEDRAKGPPAADRVDRNLPVRLQGREDDAEPEGADPPAGQRRRGRCLLSDVFMLPIKGIQLKKSCSYHVSWVTKACLLLRCLAQGSSQAVECCFVDGTCSKATGLGRCFFADGGEGRWRVKLWQQSGFWGWLSWEKSPIVHELGGCFCCLCGTPSYAAFGLFHCCRAECHWLSVSLASCTIWIKQCRFFLFVLVLTHVFPLKQKEQKLVLKSFFADTKDHPWI